MQVKETQNDGLKRGYQMTLPAADLAKMVDEKLKEAQPEVEMKGFRKGKVPMAMLKKQFGPRVMGDAMQDSIDGALRAHLETTGDRPAVQPKIEMQDGENWKEGDDVVVNVAYEVLPVIPEVDLSKLNLERLVVKAEDAAVTEALENLAKNAKSYEDKKKGSKAAKDDGQYGRLLAAMIVACACNAEGAALFKAEDTDALQGQQADVIDRVAKLAMRLNGMDAEAADETKKESGTTGKNGSGTA